jgi:two-component system, chemotaxis family, sensor kinase Cph1
VTAEVNENDPLEACAREPVHAPGAIQPHGMLVLLDDDGRSVLQASTNTESLSGMPAADLVGRSVKHLIGERAARRLREGLSRRSRPVESLTLKRSVRQAAAAPERSILRASAWRMPAGVMLEIEPAASAAHALQWLEHANMVIADLDDARSRKTLMTQLAREIRQVTGHERVKIYAFDEDWHGEVIAESRIEDIESYLGHHFPASDIPPQVRAMYASNRVRMIPDANAHPSTLVATPAAATGGPLDLSSTSLRAVAPIHLQYLHNMGIAASLSIAIREGDNLWGLVACHSRQPHRVQPHAREAALSITVAATQRLFALIRGAEQNQHRRMQALRRSFVHNTDATDPPGTLLRRHGKDLLRLFSACGAALVTQDDINRFGLVPADASLRRLVMAFSARTRGQVLVFDRHDDLPVALPREFACGVLAAPLGMRRHDEWLLLFRPEKRQAVTWAGNPDKPLENRDDGVVVSPRQSFAAWREVVEGRSKAWTEALAAAAEDIAHDLAVVASTNEVSALNTELREEQSALARANEELSRRADTDELTGLWNRRCMTRAVNAEADEALRYGRVFAFIILDVDNFKAVNDRFGHDVGDQVLCAIAQTLADEMRGTDRIARWGGEEFVALATGTDEAGARELAERLRAVVEAAEIPKVGSITISLGATAWQEGDDVAALFRRADRSLLAAKRGGRNRVMTVADLPSEAAGNSPP